MANLKTCINCGRLFSGDTEAELCETCSRETNTTLDAARLYLESHAETSIEELCKVTNTTLEEMLKYFRENKLVLKGRLTDALTCEICGKPLATGRLCDDCAADMSQALKDAFKKEESPLKLKNISRKPKDEKMTSYHHTKRG